MKVGHKIGIVVVTYLIPEFCECVDPIERV